MQFKEHYNVVLYGDSIAKGIVYDDEKGKYSMSGNSFAQIVQHRLKGMLHNAGRFGCLITKGAEKLQHDVLNKRPDIVLLEFGGNDCDFDWGQIAQHPSEQHEPRTNLDRYTNTLRSMIATLKDNGIVPVLMSLPPLDADKYFRWISNNNESSAANILSWLGSVSRIYWWHERYNAAIIQVAEEMNTKWIDVRGAFLQAYDFRKFICSDGIHPNELGHRLIADKITDYMKAHYRCLLKSV
ncbi:SGNH/GDSL hydrolase family protein [Paenibacillus profundus]|uniref:SGNH/GDSL hydrolase family protein n=1 Tax=Paenibacillus profundus TaxID=1173085 RepID=A0ABS8YID9_9BACL|nr:MULTISPECIES: SGNH/GDSL hydrolase family protein [Paenibacillus]MCE5170320.1 SGNH/GDSL hydrolase family protein [Paenibacillus profundus]MCM3340781.1 SGNH/GDSL hydrolase family protein [Paenibacillus sp. MER TA 81-3]